MALDSQKIFSGFTPRGGVVVAVSGGSDSLALLFLAHEWCKTHGTDLMAVTVDHGLRAESAHEAEAVAVLCHARGIRHRTMKWEGAKPSSGVISAARTARYDLLAKAAKEFDADVVLSGHTLDDQAETIAMRLMRSEAGTGLSGMARSTLFMRTVWIVRPLLKIRRLALRDYLRAYDLDWVEDPSNSNPAFERVRVRASLEDAQIVSLAQKAEVESLARMDISNRAAKLIEQCAEHISPGLLRLDPQFFTSPDKAARHAFRTLLAVMGGVAFLPDRQKADDLFSLVKTGSLRATLSRTLVDVRKGGVWLLREARDLPVLQADEESQLWDGRWQVNRLSGKMLAAQGLESAKKQALPLVNAPQSLVLAALSTEPACVERDAALSENAVVPVHEGDVCAERVLAPFLQFMPQFDCDLAAAIGKLFKVKELPSLPWNNHIDV